MLSTIACGSFDAMYIQIPVLCVFVTVVYWVTVTFYRLTLHPLASYPGPFWAKITGFHDAYHHSICDDGHHDFHKMHLKYGPVYRYSPNGLSFNTHTALQTIHSSKANVQKASYYATFPIRPGAWSIASAIDKHVHSRKRRILSHSFSSKAIKEMEQCVLPHIRKFCTILSLQTPTAKDKMPRVTSEKTESLGNGAMNVATKATYLTWDIMADFVLSDEFNTQLDPRNRNLKSLVEARMRTVVLYGRMPWLKATNALYLFMPRIANLGQEFADYAMSSMSARLARSTPTIDVVHYIHNTKDPETGSAFDTRELLSEAAGLIIAGSDTTGICLSATLYYLSQPEYSHIVQRLRSELFEHFGSKDVENIVAGPELSACNYLRAVIDESLRLAPPVPGALPREILRGGMDIDGSHIPAGIDVVTPIYALHHNEAAYPDAWRFKPERWLGEGVTSEQARVQTDAFSPFGIGNRGCLGKNMAYMELSLTVARVVWLFDFVKSEESDMLSSGLNGEYKLRDQFTALKDGPFLKFIERLG